MDLHVIAGKAVSLLARERRAELAALEGDVPTVSSTALDPTYLARRNALLCAGLRWGLARLRAEVELTRAEGALEAAELTRAEEALGLKRRKAGPIKSSAHAAVHAARVSKDWTAANIAALDGALDALAGRFHFDADAVRTMVGLPRFTGNAVPNATTRELTNELISNFIADLETTETQT